MQEHQTPSPVDPRPERETMPRRTTSRELLGEGKLLVIDHDGAEYLLRVTANGRLLLTK